MTFRWSFGGLRCDEDRAVAGVNVIIPGELLANDGRYSCQANGFDGIVLHRFAPGTYSFRLEGVGYGNELLYEVQGSFTVNGNVTVDVDMTPVGAPPSFAYLSWLFPPNSYSHSPNCNQAGITFVEASVDGGEFERFDCWDGQGGEQIRTPYLTPDYHFVELVAVDGGGLPWYYFGGDILTQLGRPTSHTASLWAIGGASVRWELRSRHGTPLSCYAAGLNRVGINFRDIHTGELVYGDVGDWHDCVDGPNEASVVVYQFLRPGRYVVEMYARAGDGREYFSPEGSPVIDVVAHEFPGPNASLPVYLIQD
ncbi:hypothetical protein [Corallococcus macrosporus]|uniref:hypothetical protein n=1 Tax=Corallococcus macrosporus TaxID=35 RepID=UPI001EFE325D|nr:hypothetical protein [Corallococcus macrosporus]